MVLTTTHKDIHHRADEASAPALTATPIASSKVDIKPITVHALAIKIKPPTFDGDPLSWGDFSKLFESVMADTAGLYVRLPC